LLIALFGHESESEADDLRATAGAVILLDYLQELRNIRRLLTPPKG
jgi:hypothetical protein